MIHVPIPAAGADLRRYVEPLLTDAAFRSVLDLDVRDHDELAQVTAVAVRAVHADAAAVAVHYDVHWEAFHACSDQAAAGVSQRVTRGRVEGGDWVFAAHVPPPATQWAGRDLMAPRPSATAGLCRNAPAGQAAQPLRCRPRTRWGRAMAWLDFVEVSAWG